MLGTTLNEWRSFILPNPMVNDLSMGLFELVASHYTMNNKALMEYYSPTRFGSTALALSAMGTGVSIFHMSTFLSCL